MTDSRPSLEKLAAGCRVKAALYFQAHPEIPASFNWIADEIDRLRATPPAEGETIGPPLRLCGYCQTWNSKPCGEQCHWSPIDPIHTPAPAQPKLKPKMLTMLRIIEAAGGEVGCDDSPHSWLNYFCDDAHPTDTFNEACEAGFLRVTHDNRFDASTAFLTDAGRSAISSTESK